ncbi:MAG: molybdopterin molybdotransferase MoeA [Spirochaetales bacterium]|nr:molybdopterin molybdotransferase MoeA [Spirochaetales bacterium]
MTTVAEVDYLLMSLIPPARVECVPLVDSARRCLAQAVVADRDGPPYARVAMDGWAVRGEVGPWTKVGRQPAGAAPLTLTAPDHCIEVATGAVLPEGADRVLPYEDAQTEDSVVRAAAQVKLPPGRHVHAQGHDYRRGQVLINEGVVLKAPHFHTLATVGLDKVPVRHRLSWALAATGDELVEVSQTPLPWQIRRSNAAAIAAEAQQWGLGPKQEVILADEITTMTARLAALIADVEVLVLTGGVSAGMYDLVPRVMESLGAKTIIRRVAQRPGKPLWVGTWDKGQGPTIAFGLPGNPVSSLFAFRRYVLPWLLAAEGQTLEVPRVFVDGLEPIKSDQTLFLPWSRRRGVLDWRGSGDFLALGESDGFLEICSEERSWSEPKVYLWGGAS